MQQLDSSQQRALENVFAVTGRIAVLTGGPGTGKNFTINAILYQALKRFDREYIYVAAPTGKAAKVICDAITVSLTNEPSTIHRMLGCLGPGGWTFDQDNKLEAKLIILDESSMQDSMLLVNHSW